MAIEEPTYDPKFRPTTSDVAVFIKNRTVDNHNNFIGDFTDATIVTADEVNHIITQAGSLVLSALRWDPTAPEPTIPDDNVPTVITLIALLTAIFVEITKFSEQVARNVSPYPYLKQLFDDMLGQKQGELGITTGQTGMSIVDVYLSQSKTAQFTFPDDPMVNWQTAF
jgi:hypothetical protein